MKKRFLCLFMALLMALPLSSFLFGVSKAFASSFEIKDGKVTSVSTKLNGTLLVNGGLASDIDSSRRWEVVTDGEFPVWGQDNTVSADTYPARGLITPADGIHTLGFTFEKPYKFTKFVYQQGFIFWDGGWFDGKVSVEVFDGENWTEIEGVVWDNEYNINLDPNVPMEPQHENNSILGDEYKYMIYEITIPENVIGYGLRISGKAGGCAKFISCGELEVYGTRSFVLPAKKAPVTTKNIKSEAVAIWANNTEVTDSAAAIRDNKYRAYYDSTRDENRFDTWGISADNGKVSFGYTFSESYKITGIAFQFAEFYDNGGWFRGSVSVEYLNSDGEWIAVTGVKGHNTILTDSNLNADAVDYIGATITAEFDATETTGIRIKALGAGNEGAEWVSCSEFDVYAEIDKTNLLEAVSKDMITMIKVNDVDQSSRMAPVIDGIYRTPGDNTRDENRADTWQLGVTDKFETVIELVFSEAQNICGLAFQYADFYANGGWFVDTVKVEYYDAMSESWKPVRGLWGNLYTPNVAVGTQVVPQDIMPYIGATLTAYFDEVSTSSVRILGAPAWTVVPERFVTCSEIDVYKKGAEISGGEGSVVPDPSVETVNINFKGAAESTEVVEKNTEFEFTVTVPEGKKIASVKAGETEIFATKGDIYKAAVYKYTPVDNTAIDIEFAEIAEYTVAVTGNNITLSSSSLKIKEGETAKVEFTLDAGYEIDKLEIANGKAEISGNKIEISEITSNTTLNVTSKLKNYSIKFIINMGSVDCERTSATKNDVVQYKIVLPEGNYRISSIKVNGIEVDSCDENMTLENITKDTTVLINVEEFVPPDDGENNAEKGLSVGAIIGIVAACVAVIGGGAAAFVFIKKKKM